MNEHLYNDAYLNKSTEVINYIKHKSYDLLPLDNLHLKILEIGCGNGYDAIELAKKNISSTITGIDIEHNLIQTAQKNAFKSGCRNIDFLLSDVENMPFESYSFDVIRAERVFQHLKNSEMAFKEMNRVLKPGGTISIIETDWAGMNIYNTTNNYILENKINQTLVEKVLVNGMASRKMISYYKQIGISTIDMQVFPIILDNYKTANELIKFDHIIDTAVSKNILSPEEKNIWINSVQHANEQSCFKVALNVLIYTGSKR